MLKVWVWKKRSTDSICRVSPTEPDGYETVGQRRISCTSPNDILVCGRYIRSITGKNPTLKPKAFWVHGCVTKPPSV